MHFFKDNVHFSCHLSMALAAWWFSSWKKVTSSTCIMELEIISYCLSFDAYIVRMLMVCWKDTRTKEWKTFWNYTIKPLCGMMVCTSLNCKKKRMTCSLFEWHCYCTFGSMNQVWFNCIFTGLKSKLTELSLCLDTQSYVLNFHGRVTQASVKNFQIVLDADGK